MTLQAVLNYLNPFNYFHTTRSEPQVEGDCPICLAALNQRVEAAVETPLNEVHQTVCGHYFHGPCLATWVTQDSNRNQSCPLCRAQQCVGNILNPSQDQLRHVLLDQREARFEELFESVNEHNYLEVINEVIGFLSDPFLESEEDIVRQLNLHFQVQKFLVQSVAIIFKNELLPFDRAFQLFEIFNQTSADYTQALDQRPDVNDLFLQYIDSTDAEDQYVEEYEQMIDLIKQKQNEQQLAQTLLD